MRQKLKTSWIWNLLPGKNMYTALGNTIYYPKNSKPASGHLLEHELVHLLQQEKVGLLKFLFLYIFCLPLFWNPWRYKWEYAAFKYGHKYSDRRIKKILKSKAYGYLSSE